MGKDIRISLWECGLDTVPVPVPVPVPALALALALACLGTSLKYRQF